jgi:hypothetical protein
MGHKERAMNATMNMRLNTWLFAISISWIAFLVIAILYVLWMH